MSETHLPFTITLPAKDGKSIPQLGQQHGTYPRYCLCEIENTAGYDSEEVILKYRDSDGNEIVEPMTVPHHGRIVHQDGTFFHIAQYGNGFSSREATAAEVADSEWGHAIPVGHVQCRSCNALSIDAALFCRMCGKAMPGFNPHPRPSDQIEYDEQAAFIAEVHASMSGESAVSAMTEKVWRAQDVSRTLDTIEKVNAKRDEVPKRRGSTFYAILIFASLFIAEVFAYYLTNHL